MKDSEKRVLEKLFENRPRLVDCEESIVSALAMIVECYDNGGKILLCGNGGSASDCEHFAGELNKSFKLKRPFPKVIEEKLSAIPDNIREKLEAALPAIPLPSLTSSMTAFINDRGADPVYAQLASALGKPGDILVAFSTSGNSENCCEAVLTAKALGLKTLSLTGESGGSLKCISDCTICVPAKETYLVQEYHLSVYHALAAMAEEHFFGNNF